MNNEIKEIFELYEKQANNSDLAILIKTLKEYYFEKEDYKLRINKANKFLEELISSTKGVLNDYSYHKEHNKILIELLKEDIEYYKKALDILRGNE